MLAQYCCHYLLEAVKLGSMQGFCHVISDHLICWTIFNVNVAFGLLIGNIEVSDVQMMRALASTLAFVGLKQHGTFVFLIEDVLLDWISLCLEKYSCAYHWGDDFISSYHFHFGRTSCVHTLLPAERSNGSITH